ncbi:MAG: sulfotransferase, partial [Gammaproteobacteria bacterium]|nr:sulfotransferase [Gammaproteobacteria bacterium]NIR63378.1 sulfotransferase [candidate division Zixibacteria bacterium]NIT56198.1 sulfotransferase [Fodinibius sp.]NIR95551.1 sulfotransferase [Gammaproteobacteria bacterium]NIS45374.1 sulfotransferase [candidate division Zixibacteria bacterium]
TLVDQIISSHPLVKSAGETDILYKIVTSEFTSHYSYTIKELDKGKIQGIAEKYIEKLTAITGPAEFITDKSLMLHEHIGLLHLIFPASRIIFCKRDPV